MTRNSMTTRRQKSAAALAAAAAAANKQLTRSASKTTLKTDSCEEDVDVLDIAMMTSEDDDKIINDNNSNASQEDYAMPKCSRKPSPKNQRQEKYVHTGRTRLQRKRRGGGSHAHTRRKRNYITNRSYNTNKIKYMIGLWVVGGGGK